MRCCIAAVRFVMLYKGCVRCVVRRCLGGFEMLCEGCEVLLCECCETLCEGCEGLWGAV